MQLMGGIYQYKPDRKLSEFAVQKFGLVRYFDVCLIEAHYAHQGCIYFI